MASLEYVGKTASTTAGVLGHLKYINDKKAASLTQAQVDARINTLFSGYATLAEVDAGDAGATNTTYVDQQDALRVPLAWKGTANGVATLTSGKVTPAQLPTIQTQRNIKKLYSPSSYGGNQSSTGNEITLFTVSIPDPGYPYFIHAFGVVNVNSDSPDQGAGIYVRANTTSAGANVIATGVSRWGVGASDCTFMPADDYAATPRTGAMTLYVRGYRYSGTGTVTFYAAGANMYVQIIAA